MMSTPKPLHDTSADRSTKGHILPTSEIRSKNRLQLTDVNVIGGSIQHPCCLWLNRGNSLW